METQSHHTHDLSAFGFWVYLMTDLMLFAALFATYAVLRNNTFGAISMHKLFNPSLVLGETMILLTSSFTCGLAILAAQRKRPYKTLAAMGVTFLLGIAFLFLEISEFSHLLSEGNSFQRSGFLSAFFTLVGTHGLHITLGSVWLVILMIQVFKWGLRPVTLKRLTLFSLFWHFLDIVWIFIFTIVYLMGA
jgi:cytochrome o ubiquinol oxidase subunit 3